MFRRDPNHRRGTGGHRYRLLYDGQGKDGEKFLLGLADPDQLPE